MNLVQEVLERGNNTIGRNGLVRKLWAPTPLRVESVANSFPLLLNRPTAFYKSCLETFFFLSGESSYDSMPEVLRNSWWAPWASQAQARSSWGRFYGTQLRAQVTDTPGVYFDPLNHLIQQLKEVLRTGIENRKMVVSLWHTPDTLSVYTQTPAVLESCHSTCLVFDLERTSQDPDSNKWKLNLHHTQRSLDLVNGTAADLVYSGLLMELFCELLNFEQKCNDLGELCSVEAGTLVFAPVNTHIYGNHLDGITQHFMEWSLSTEPSHLPCKINFPYAGGPVLRSIINGTKFYSVAEVKEFVSISHPTSANQVPFKFPLNA
jgi:thymidylate synthase